MKKITSTIIGFSLALATAGISMAQTPAAPAAPAANSASSTSTATTGTKKVKKHKKAVTTTPSATSTAPSK